MEGHVRKIVAKDAVGLVRGKQFGLHVQFVHRNALAGLPVVQDVFQGSLVDLHRVIFFFTVVRKKKPWDELTIMLA